MTKVPINIPIVDVVAHNWGNCTTCATVRVHPAPADGPDTICRTCIHAKGNRLQNVTLPERARLRQEAKETGRAVPDMRCDPTDNQISKVLRNDRTMVPLSQANEITVTVRRCVEHHYEDCSLCWPRDPHTEAKESRFPLPMRSAAVVNSCGWTQAPKCTNCVRFRPTSVNTYREAWAGGRIDKWSVAVGGHCSLPEGGIEINGEMVTCDPVAKVAYSGAENPSCNNCQFKQVFGRDWIVDELSMTIGVMDLTAYEMDQARRGAGPDAIGRSIGAARQAKASYSFYVNNRKGERIGIPSGRWMYYPDVTIVDRSTRTIVTAVHRFDALGIDCCPTTMVPQRRRRVIAAPFDHPTAANSDVVRNGWLMVGRHVHRPTLDVGAVDVLATTMAFGRTVTNEHRSDAVDALRRADWERIHTTYEQSAPTVVVDTVMLHRCVPALVEREVVDSYTVRFGKTISTRVITMDDPSIFEMYELGDNKATLRVLQPHHHRLGLPEAAYRAAPNLSVRSLRNPNGIVVPEPMSNPTTYTPAFHSALTPSILLDPVECDICTSNKTCNTHAGRCSDCDYDNNRACYWHARVPKRITGYDLVTKATWGDWKPQRPEGHAYDDVERNPKRILGVRRYGDVFVVTDADGDVPNIVLFRSQRRDLITRATARYGKAAGQAVERQYLALLSTVAPHARIQPSSNAGRTWAGIEPFKPYCTLNLAEPSKGINFRDAWGDRFGIGRGSIEFSNSVDRELDLDEWIRAHNPGARVQEEFAINARIVEDADAPDSLTPREIVGSQDEYYATIDWQTPIHFSTGSNMMFGDGSTKDFLIELDAPVGLKDDDEVEIDRRLALYGYRNLRTHGGTARSSKEPNMAFDHESRDPDDVAAVYRCETGDPSHALPPTKVDKNNLTCLAVDPNSGKECLGTLFWVEPRGGEHFLPHRVKRGVGDLVVTSMSRQFRTERLLEGYVCASWQKRGGGGRTVTLATLGLVAPTPEPVPSNTVAVGDIIDGILDGVRRKVHLIEPVLRFMWPKMPTNDDCPHVIFHSNSPLGEAMIGRTRGATVTYAEGEYSHSFRIVRIERTGAAR